MRIYFWFDRNNEIKRTANKNNIAESWHGKTSSSPLSGCIVIGTFVSLSCCRLGACTSSACFRKSFCPSHLDTWLLPSYTWQRPFPVSCSAQGASLTSMDLGRHTDIWTKTTLGLLWLLWDLLPSFNIMSCYRNSHFSSSCHIAYNDLLSSWNDILCFLLFQNCEDLLSFGFGDKLSISG